MKLWVFSDLHLEYADLSSPLAIPEADVCVVAGDLMRAPANGVHWLAQHVMPAMPCVYVAGNHEFYRGGIKECLEDGRAAAERFSDVHFLENDFVIVGGVRFIGATLWTDFRIDGTQHLSMHHARERMNDYRRIALQRSPWQRFVPAAACRMHQDSRRFIEETLHADRDIPTVVVSHHLPSIKSIPARFDRDFNGAYASNLEDVIEDGRPALWIHGHTHESCDYTLGHTRVVCNPRGYADENAAFNRQLVVEVRT
jgi:Icc-related predicted phosphoesterase